MDVHAVVGGAACHWGRSGRLCRGQRGDPCHSVLREGRPWHEAYNFLNDAGHAENGIYAIRAICGFDNLGLDDLKKFRSIHSKLTGHGESHLNPEGVLVSNGPPEFVAARGPGTRHRRPVGRTRPRHDLL